MRYKIIILLIAMFTLNGLNNSREINDLAIVSAIGIDKVDNENYKVTAVILNPSKSESGSSSDSDMAIYESKDKTIQEAIRKMIKESPKRLYLAHMELLLISDGVAKEDLVNVFDYFIRDNEGSSEFLFTLVKDGDTETALKIKTPTTETTTDNIVNSIKSTAKYLGTTIDNQLNDSIEYVLEDGEELVMPSISIVEMQEDNKEEKEDDKNSDDSSTEQKNKRILVGTLGYFNNNKLQGYLTEEESVAYNILRNNFKSGVIQVEKEDTMVAEFVNCSSKIKPKYENGKYIIDVEIKGDCNITEVSQNIGNIDYSNIRDYEKIVEEKVNVNIEKFIYNCQNVYKLDLIGFGKIFREKLNKEYKKIEKSFYTEIFPNIQTNVTVKIEFPNDGGINKKW